MTDIHVTLSGLEVIIKDIICPEHVIGMDENGDDITEWTGEINLNYEVVDKTAYYDVAALEAEIESFVNEALRRQIAAMDVENG